MALPKVIQIGWRSYNVISSGRDGVAGECDFDKAEIYIKPGDDAYMAHTLLHEILHGCYEQAGLRRKDTEERIVTGLANTLAQVLRDNPTATEFIISGLKQ